MIVKVRKESAEEHFSGVRWTADTEGFCECPGQHTHTAKDTEAKVWIAGAPTIKCLHQSCIDIVEDANRKFRRAIYLAERDSGEIEEVDPAILDAKRERRDRLQQIREVAEEELEELIATPVPPKDWADLSPTKLDKPERDDWKLALSLFKPDGVVWIGDKFDTGKPEHARHFRPVRDWLKSPFAPGPFICPAYFKAGSFSRSNQNVVNRQFLVLESDALTKPEMGAVIKWFSQQHRLVAIVDTGGKSLHAWFVPPTPQEMDPDEMKATFLGMKLDISLLRPSQPCRLPGIKRSETGKWQRFRYLNLAFAQSGPTTMEGESNE